MEFPKFPPQFLDPVGPNQQVIVIRQNAPGVDCRRKLSADIQQGSFTFSHPFVSCSDDWSVLISRG